MTLDDTPLTPEEERRLYVEETVRLAAFDRYRQDKSHRRWSMFWKVLMALWIVPVMALLLLILVGGIIGQQRKASDVHKQPTLNHQRR